MSSARPARLPPPPLPLGAALPPVTEVLCPGITSQVAMAEGALTEATALANGAIAAARRLGLDRQYLAFSAFRTAALLALERRDLATAADLPSTSSGCWGVAVPSSTTWPNWTGPGYGRRVATLTRP